MPEKKKSIRPRPALTDEDRENQLIAACVDEAERQILEHRASSQIIAHYLKLGATRQKAALELQILEKKKELITAQTEAINSTKELRSLCENAVKAIREYSGNGGDNID